MNNKKDKLIIRFVVAITILCCVIAFSSGYSIINNYAKNKFGVSLIQLLKDKNLANFIKVYTQINDNYFYDINKNAAIESAISGYLSGIGENYTTYLNPEQSSELMGSLSGTYKGIGIGISNKNNEIVSITKDSPAEESELEVGDIIVEVNGVDVTESTSGEISQLIRNNTELKIVKLKVKRGEDVLNIDVKMGTLLDQNIDYGVIEDEIGYIYINSFTDTLDKQISEALTSFDESNIEKLIIDVRNNGGGYLASAEKVASLFLKKGKLIYSLEDKKGTIEYKDETDESKEYKIVVLINEYSASASEVLCAALMDSYSATSVGKTSFGKGRVQKVISLDDGAMAKYSSAKWYRPNGECIDEIGIKPTYEVELKYETDGNGVVINFVDLQLEKAIEVLK